MAMGIATIAKVSIAYKNLSAAVEDYNMAKKIYAVNMKITNILKNQTFMVCRMHWKPWI